jgi:hypothetical protein
MGKGLSDGGTKGWTLRGMGLGDGGNRVILFESRRKGRGVRVKGLLLFLR